MAYGAKTRNDRFHQPCSQGSLFFPLEEKREDPGNKVGVSSLHDYNMGSHFFETLKTFILVINCYPN